MTLRQVFTIFAGIGAETQRRYRAAGYRDWQDILGDRRQLGLFHSPLEAQITEAEDRYAARDARYFYARLPGRLAYLVCLEFPEQVTFLDIEATGLSRVYHHITLVGWSNDGRSEHELIGRDKRLGDQVLATLDEAPLAVTFNGNLYDLPFLRTVAALPPVCSVDLRFFCFRLGHPGSQKSVERQLGILRPAHFVDTRGEDAPALWFKATRGDRRALRRLVEYNHLDLRGMSEILRTLSPAALLSDGITAGGRRSASPTNARPGVQRRQSFPRTPRRPRLSRADLDHALDQISDDARPLLVPGLGATDGLSVVGIDLTGSDRRPSGLAHLRGTSMDTSLVRTDEDILRHVRERRPQIVSIDAPLSLPTGRTRVTDDDPARSDAGIMRWSERELKRRGVNVYPCLLPSMQNLTARGIRLAETLRAEGFATIECYPGAAQDILSMPRKGVGVEFLRRALADAGWQLPERTLNHDELDAVTAAIVGVFFLDDRYEALGTQDEDPMVVPQVSRPVHSTELVVAFSGAIGAGKTTASRWMERHGFAYTRYSDAIADEAHRRGLQGDRRTLQRLGYELHESWGQRGLGNRVLKSVTGRRLVVVDGLRWRSDAAFLREVFGPRLVHVHLEVDPRTRRQRYVRDGHSLSEFDAANGHPVERETSTLSALADHVVSNDADAPHRLYTALDRIGIRLPRGPQELLVPTTPGVHDQPRHGTA